MNYLDKIYMPDGESGNECIAIFFYSKSCTGTFQNGSGTLQENTKKENHCEMFPKSAVSSVGLNKKSFVLRFKDGRDKRTIKFKFTDQELQVQALAGLIEHTLGGGLKVISYYSNFFTSLKE